MGGMRYSDIAFFTIRRKDGALQETNPPSRSRNCFLAGWASISAKGQREYKLTVKNAVWYDVSSHNVVCHYRDMAPDEDHS